MFIKELDQHVVDCVDADYDTFKFEDSDVILLDISTDDLFQINKLELDGLAYCFANRDEYGQITTANSELYTDLCATWRLRGLSNSIAIYGAQVIRGTTQYNLQIV